MSPYVAIILAGGAGARLGGLDKARLLVGGVPLLLRVAAGLAGADPILLATGRNDPVRLPGPFITVADAPGPAIGPLAGLLAGLDWLDRTGHPADMILTVAVDTPFFPAGFAAAASAALGRGAAVLARHAGQDYPTNALWRRTAIADLPARVAAGTAPKSLLRLANELGAARLDWPGSPAENPFANVNTITDLIMANRRALGTEAYRPPGNFGLGKGNQTR